MVEYVERGVLYEKAYWHGEYPDIDNPYPDGVEAVDVRDIDSIPAADVKPVVHGRWEKDVNVWEESPTSYCSCCGQGLADECIPWFKYCSNCGARMDGDC